MTRTPAAVIALLLVSAWLTACGRRADVPRDATSDSTASATSPGSAVIGNRQMKPKPEDTTERVTNRMAAGGGAQRNAGASSPQRASDAEQLTGKIVVTGSDAAIFVTLQVPGRRSVRLLGEMVEELRRLSAATVRVEGTIVGGARSAGLLGGSLNVKSYEVLAIDGERPHVGILVAGDGALWLASSDTVQLAAAPDDLQSEAGAKVWIIGQSAGAGLRVQSYGIISER